MKKTIRDYDLKGKKVIIRCDFNVPMDNSVITDDTRIKESLKTIEYAINNKAKVILMSHLGRVKEESDKKDNSLKPVAIRLSEYLKQEVKFIGETRGSILEDAIKNMNDGDIILIENTRFEDIDGKKESSNDLELGKYWASLGDLFINDAFGTAHRAHASNVGIASNLDNGVGFLIEKELECLDVAINNPERPFTVILGGSKVKDKIGVIENVVKKADYLLIGGGMAYTFLKASGIEIGKSLLDSESLEFCKNILENYSDKVILPIDIVTGMEIDVNTSHRTCFVNEMKDSEMGLDIGPKTVNLFKQYLDLSKTVIWNGPVGVFELEPFSNGTKNLGKIISELDSKTIIGGGDTAAAMVQFGFNQKMTHVSTGGGASLELLEGKDLPGISIITNK